jgi:hypothetical protein
LRAAQLRRRHINLRLQKLTAVLTATTLGALPDDGRTRRDWRKVKTAGWRAGNRDRWRLFEKR